MIRGLVEHEEVRVPQRQPREREAAALAAGKDRHGALHFVAAKEEACEEVARLLIVQHPRGAHRLEDRLVAGELGLRLL